MGDSPISLLLETVSVTLSYILTNLFLPVPNSARGSEGIQANGMGVGLDRIANRDGVLGPALGHFQAFNKRTGILRGYGIIWGGGDVMSLGCGKRREGKLGVKLKALYGLC